MLRIPIQPTKIFTLHVTMAGVPHVDSFSQLGNGTTLQQQMLVDDSSGRWFGLVVYHCTQESTNGWNPNDWWFGPMFLLFQEDILRRTMLVFMGVSFWYCGMAIHPITDLEYPKTLYICRVEVFDGESINNLGCLKVIGFCYLLPRF